jgi:RNA polymerase sigma-70 factor (ECF subfamily)
MEPIAISQPIPETGGQAAVADEDFASIVNLYRPRVFRFALAALRDRDAAETIAQDCFLRAYKARASFRGNCSLNTWLMQIAVNLVRDHLRNRRLQFWRRLRDTSSPVEGIGASVADGRGSPEHRALEKEKVEAVWAAAAALPERQRTVFLLRFVEDMELLEIVAATGMKEGTVKTHLFRALHAVRQRLGVEA